ncbi:MAB_1171c family putative transporter [Catenuloplanes atrovinosus]|uniref:DUF6545 domain-containing protein n=1 Tax=Catenuloplanes atrovinosus TaxID=137266 RepID=A0AAE3YSM0_9ACTN|nr:MAB_1171c family putative transporter [Catenuloplanes atrovinosus]MDR7277683.1 hypothetical protein [Catenuloplanes atrovinosus]
MPEIGHLIALGFAATALAVKLVALIREPSNPATRATCGILFGFGSAVAIGWEPLYLAIDEASGVPNLAKVFENGSALIAAAGFQVLFLHLGDPPKAPARVRVRLTMLAAVIGIMSVAFWLAPVDVSEPVNFSERYATLPQIGVYFLFYLAYLAIAVTDILRMSLRYARRVNRKIVRFSLRLLSIGSMLGLGYVAHKALFIITEFLGGNLPWPESAGSQLFITSCIGFIALSFTISSVGTAVVAAWRWPAQDRLYRRLYPLWLAFYSVAPEIARQPGTRLATANLPLLRPRWLYRRYIEIGDGRLEIADFLASTTAQRAFDIAYAATVVVEGQRAGEVAGEAARVLVAVELYRTTVPIEEPADDVALSPATPTHPGDIDDEMEAQAAISDRLSSETAITAAREALAMANAATS